MEKLRSIQKAVKKGVAFPAVVGLRATGVWGAVMSYPDRCDWLYNHSRFEKVAHSLEEGIGEILFPLSGYSRGGREMVARLALDCVGNTASLLTVVGNLVQEEELVRAVVLGVGVKLGVNLVSQIASMVQDGRQQNSYGQRIDTYYFQ